MEITAFCYFFSNQISSLGNQNEKNIHKECGLLLVHTYSSPRPLVNGALPVAIKATSTLNKELKVKLSVQGKKHIKVSTVMNEIQRHFYFFFFVLEKI